MKMRASLLHFGAAVTVVVIVAIVAFSVAHREIKMRAGSETRARQVTHLTEHQIADSYGEMPLRFEKNIGQTAPEVQFLSHGSGYQIFLTPQQVVLELNHPERSKKSLVKARTRAALSRRASVLRLHFDAANSDVEMTGIDKLPGRIDYFMGKNPRNWHTDVPSYGRVAYCSIYPGVDALFYGSHRQLEYDLVVAPGANPRQISLSIEGARSMRVDRSGNLVMHVSAGDVELMKPAVYQEVSGSRRLVAANYVVTGNRVHFWIGSYDSNAPLVIDPVLNYSTYLGGGPGNSFWGYDGGYSIAVNGSGDAFVTGSTSSTTYPTTASPISPSAGADIADDGAAFVTELNPTGTAELYSSYLTGDGGEAGYGIAIDPPGGVSSDVYVVGETFSDNFPGTGGATGFEPNPPADILTVGAGFVAKIDPTKSGAAALVYSSYLGGSGNIGEGFGDFANAIAVDASGNAYVAGSVISTDFPMSSPSTTIQGLTSSLGGNAFLVKVNASGSALAYSTYLGGTSPGTSDFDFGDEALGVTVDSSSNAYIVGTTTSGDFPTTASAFEPGPLPTIQNETGFVSRIDTTKSGAASLIYSTFLGSPGQSQPATDHDYGVAIALGPSNVAFVTGGTSSPDFPTTAGAYSTSAPSGSGVAFFTKVDTTQTGSASLVYSTFLGGSDGDSGRGIAADSSGNGYIGGATQSADFPITLGAFQTAIASGGSGDGFIAEINPQKNGTADLVYSTYFGGSGSANGIDVINALALDSTNNVYVTGQTFSSAGFPVYPANAFQTSLTGSDNTALSAAFVAKLTLEPTLAFNPLTLPFGNQAEGTSSTPMTVTLTNNTTSAIAITIQTVTGANPTDFTQDAGTTTCTSSVPAGSSCTIGMIFTPTTFGSESATLPIAYTAGSNAQAVQNISMTGTGTGTPNFTLTPAGLTFGGQLITTTSASQPATLTNTGTTAISISIAVSAGFGETDNCPTGSGQTLAGGASCTINVTFTPASSGPVTGTLTATSSGVAQTTQLTGTGWDFSLTSLPSSLTLTNGSGSFTGTIAASTGFTPTVNVSCSASISSATCTPSPGSGMPGTQITFNVMQTAAVPPGVYRVPPVAPRLIVLAAIAMLLFSLLPFLRRRRIWLGVAGAMVLLVGLSACSNNPKGPSSFSLTITASNGGVSHTYSVSVSN
ncbi:MAG TPA: choice-of-anchor D domain-containing protein [Candidatus Limnocylindrales bacterium]|nr:choice-of-anchor D domain-containing protein [Candidatus Limnocylindrales bacterium]